MYYTESQIKRLEEWASKLGYPDPRGKVFIVIDSWGTRSVWNVLPVFEAHRCGPELLGILDKDLVFHKTPKFVVDYEDIKKSLEIFGEDSEMRRIFEFLLNKVEDKL